MDITVRKSGDLNRTMNQFYLTDIYRKLQPIIAEYTFFSSARHDHNGTFSRIDHMLATKQVVINFKILRSFLITM